MLMLILTPFPSLPPLDVQVPIEVDKVPSSVTHVVLSVGGNDGRHLLSTISNMKVAEIAEQQMNFKSEYRAAVSSIMNICPNIILVLPYSPQFVGAQKLIAVSNRHSPLTFPFQHLRTNHMWIVTVGYIHVTMAGCDHRGCTGE